MNDPHGWLLEEENPSVRYLTLRHLLGRPADDPDVLAARAAIPGWGPARAILDAQWPAGYWVAPGAGYSPRHKATVWQILFLAALGAPRTSAIDRACDYVLAHSRLTDGRFTTGKTARGAVACLNGSVLQAMYRLGYHDSRVDESLAALAEMVHRDKFCCRFNAPLPLPTRMDAGLPCVSGAVKALGAFVQAPAARQIEGVQDAAHAAILFLTGGADAGNAARLAAGTYPTKRADRTRWHRFGFPPDDSVDLLEALDVLSSAGAPPPPDLADALTIVRAKRGTGGTWRLEHTPENTWASFGTLGQPNKWVTFHALVALRKWEERA